MLFGKLTPGVQKRWSDDEQQWTKGRARGYLDITVCGTLAYRESWEIPHLCAIRLFYILHAMSHNLQTVTLSAALIESLSVDHTAIFFRPAPLAKIGKFVHLFAIVGFVTVRIRWQRSLGYSMKDWKPLESKHKVLWSGNFTRVVLAKKSAFRPSPRMKFICQHRIFLFVPELIRVCMLRLAHVDTDYWKVPSLGKRLSWERYYFRRDSLKNSNFSFHCPLLKNMT